MGCWQLLQMKQCSCQVCPLYSSLRDPAERAARVVTGGSSTRRGHAWLRGTTCSAAHPLCAHPPTSSWSGEPQNHPPIPMGGCRNVGAPSTRLS